MDVSSMRQSMPSSPSIATTNTVFLDAAHLLHTLTDDDEYDTIDISLIAPPKTQRTAARL